MTIKTQLNDSMKDAMKTGDEVRKRTVRMVLAAVKQVEVDKRIELDDMAIMALLQKEITNRRASLEEAKKANRADLIDGRLATQKVSAEAQKSQAEDLDMVQALSSFQNQQSGYEAALKAYSMVQRMSLFQYVNL